jgi:hypothetical protein
MTGTATSPADYRLRGYPVLFSAPLEGQIVKSRYASKGPLAPNQGRSVGKRGPSDPSIIFAETTGQ